MQHVHVSPEEAFQIHQNLNIHTSIGIHFGTYKLAGDRQNEPVEYIQELIRNSPEPKPDFCTLDHGESVEL